MEETMTTTRRSLASGLMLVLYFVPFAWSPGADARSPEASRQQSPRASQATVPSRPANPLPKARQGQHASEFQFNSSSRTVTMKLQLEDPNGYILSNLRRENFAVYEDGVRQKNVTVKVEHSPVTVALLMELGGRYHELNETVGVEGTHIGRKLLNVIGRDDKVAVFKYADKLDTLVDFNQSHETIDEAFERLGPEGFSEANFYDALLGTLNRMREIQGPKAIIVISSGLDTFSTASYPELLRAAQDAGTPIYTVKREIGTYGTKAPFARIDWDGAERQMEELATSSGGSAYVPESDLEIPAVYDDIMEKLRLRYVVTYVSSNAECSGSPRRIRVELIDPKTGQVLKIRDSNGKAITANVFVLESYSPNSVSGS
jgi:VWFA-related protein